MIILTLTFIVVLVYFIVPVIGISLFAEHRHKEKEEDNKDRKF